jgi:hypothetical protein
MREVSFSARAARSSRRLRISSSSRHPTTAPLAVSPKEAQLIPIAFPQPRQSFPLRRSKLRKTAWGRTQARSCALRPSGFFSFASIERGPRAVSRVIELTQGTILACSGRLWRMRARNSIITLALCSRDSSSAINRGHSSKRKRSIYTETIARMARFAYIYLALRQRAHSKIAITWL